MEFVEHDLGINAFGIWWGHTRSYANVLSTNSTGLNGNSWLVRQWATLLFVSASHGNNDPFQICVVDGGNSSLWFQRDVDGRFLPQFGGDDILQHNESTKEFTWTDRNGQRTIFYDNSSSQSVWLVGKTKAIIDPAGQQTNTVYDSHGQLLELRQATGEASTAFAYGYVESGPVDGNLASVTLLVNGRPVRRALYEYFTDDTAEGNVGDLKGATIEQFVADVQTWAPISRHHYRYYVPGDTAGFVHGLKYAIRGVAYQRMLESGLDPVTAPEDELAEFADYYFEYDASRRVSTEILEGGRKPYHFTYEVNPANPGFSAIDTWFTRTVETLPDGNENRVYCNRAGQTLLHIFRSPASEEQWCYFWQYDSEFHMILAASASAVGSVTEPVLPGSLTLTVTLKTDEGLITEQVYYEESNPSTGAVAGRLDRVTVKEGSEGEPVVLRHVEYDTREAFGQTIYPLLAEEVYTGNPSANTARTTFTYTWQVDEFGQPSFQILLKTTTYPTVTSGQNGSNSAGVERIVYDRFGQVIWRKDPRGAITHRSYDPANGALVQEIEDVDTALMSGVPAGWSTLAGWGTHLVSDYVNDSLGRVVQTRGPWHEVQLREEDPVPTSIRTVQFRAYQDEIREVRQADGYMAGLEPTAQLYTIGPVTLIHTDDSGRMTDEIQSVRPCNCGLLTADEQFPQEKWSRWKQWIFDTWGRLNAERVYHRIPLQGTGLSGANYLETIYGYDAMGRQNRVIEPSGTVRRVVYDCRGLAISNWVGTDDRGATDADPTGGGAEGNNMRPVSSAVYDGGDDGGDGNLTEWTLPVNASATNDRVTGYGYDFRNRRDRVTTTDGVNVWVATTVYDNLDRAVENTTYHTAVGDSNRIERNRIRYDLLGRIYRQEIDGVDPEDGTITQTLTGQNWYDQGTNVIKASPAGATSFTKTVYDALNRPTVSYAACVPGSAGVPEGDDNDVSDDTVLEQNETSYDPAGNIIQTTRRQRFHDATGTGALQDVNDEPKARVSFGTTWPDAIGRTRVIADYGTNGGASLQRPDVAPARSPLVLVTTYRYKDSGDANAIIDPSGVERRWENDQAGRRIKLIENYLGTRQDQSRISYYAWHASGQLERLTLVNSVTGEQVTRWIFGVTPLDSQIASNNLLRAKIYPESDDRPALLDAGPDAAYCRLEYTYNRQGQIVEFTDGDGTVHAYGYDELGRLTQDAVPTLGQGLDGSVRRIEREYEVRGMLSKVTSYSGVGGGSVVNEVVRQYDAFSNLTRDLQSHDGEVEEDTPEVQYSYADGSANTVRRTAITYPNGQVLNTAFGTANSVDDHFNRVKALQLDSEDATLVDYSYVGVAWQVRVGYVQPAVELTYSRQGDEPVGDAGDPYNGYDRFGRTVDLRWQKTTGEHEQLERIQYGFDQSSRRVWRRRVLAQGEDNAYIYDHLNQVTQAALGNLNLDASRISGVPKHTEAWDYDPTGNWQAYRADLAGNVVLGQHRVHDKGNRLTQIENEVDPILIDRVGRMRQVPPDASGDWNTTRFMVWDAWNRLMEIKETLEEGGAVIGRYAYDGLARRTVRIAEDTTRHTYFSSSWRPLEERIGDEETASAQYYWGSRHRDDLARTDRATATGGELDEVRYVLTDYFSPASIVDGAGVVTERYRFSAYGVRSILNPGWEPVVTSESHFEFAFQGQFLDTESAFLDYGYRYYSPHVGRWLSKDPVEEQSGLNIYAFLGNDPINSADLLGEKPLPPQPGLPKPSKPGAKSPAPPPPPPQKPSEIPIPSDPPKVPEPPKVPPPPLDPIEPPATPPRKIPEPPPKDPKYNPEFPIPPEKNPWMLIPPYVPRPQPPIIACLCP